MLRHFSRSRSYFFIFLVLITTSCGSKLNMPMDAPIAVLTNTPTSISKEIKATSTKEPEKTTAIQPSAAPTMTPEKPTFMDNVIFLDNSYTAKQIYDSGVSPWVVRVAPNDEILIMDHHADTIYQLSEDGTLALYASFPGFEIIEFEFDHEGTLWFSTGEHNIFKVVKDQPQLVAINANRRFKIDDNWTIYAVDFPSDGVQILSTDGSHVSKMEVVETERKFHWISISPEGEVIATATGKIVHIDKNNDTRVVISGLGPEMNGFFAPDGKLYAADYFGVDQIDLNTGASLHLDWIDETKNAQSDGMFDKKGRLLIWHPNAPLFRFDMDAHTQTMLYIANGNTPAMTVAPDGTIYAAYGDHLPNGKTTIYKLLDDGSLFPLMDVPNGIQLSLAFSSESVAYLGTADPINKPKIYEIDLFELTYRQIVTPSCDPQSVAVNPVDGHLWWFVCDRATEYDLASTYVPHILPFYAPNKYLSFAPDGTPYAMIWSGFNTSDTAAKHAVYRLDGANNWVEVADMTHPNPGITWSMITICPNGEMYAIQHLSGEDVGLDPWILNNAVISIDRETGEQKPLAIGFPNDGFSVSCGSNNHLFFTTIDGWFEFYMK